jgi:hypothetical protein
LELLGEQPTHCHGQKTGLVMLHAKVLVGKLLHAVDGPGASSVAIDEITTLDHEAFDLVGQYLSTCA